VLAPPNSLQRAGTDKALGRGRGRLSLEQVIRARVLLAQRTGADVVVRRQIIKRCSC
jgi:hypothetical protein